MQCLTTDCESTQVWPCGPSWAYSSFAAPHGPSQGCGRACQRDRPTSPSLSWVWTPGDSGNILHAKLSSREPDSQRTHKGIDYPIRSTCPLTVSTCHKPPPGACYVQDAVGDTKQLNLGRNSGMLSSNFKAKKM